MTSGGNPVTFTAQGTNPPSVWIGTTGNPGAWLANPPTDSTQYQWYKNGTPIPGATGSSYTMPYVLPSDQGAQFFCALRALGYADDSLNPIYSNSVTAVLTVATDNVPPIIAYAAAFENTNQVPSQFVINVTFSEWMDATTLTNAANYSIAGVTITNVSVAANNRTVQLLVTQMPTLPLNVTVSGVKDLTGNLILAGSSSAISGEKLTFSDIGAGPTIDPAYPTRVSVTGNGGYIITAQGSDIWNAADGFNFAWELKTGDFDMAVRQVSNGHTSRYAKGGLMVREDLSPSSRNWNIINNPSSADGILAPDNSGLGANIVECNTRSTNGAASVAWDQLLPRTNVVTYPNAWVRLKRVGNMLSGYVSSNGFDWKQVAAYDTSTNAEGALLSTVYVGLCTTAHNNDVFTDPPPSPFLYYNTVEYASYSSSFVPSAPRPVLSFGVSGGNMSVSWTPAGGHLEASPAIGAGGNWQSLGTANPATIPIGPNAQFFRVVTP